MENYGLVTYRETALLYDDQHSAAANKQRVAIVVAHELAHQWFGRRSVHRIRPIKRNTLKLSNRDVPENNPSYTTVYVGNLPHDVTQVELHCQFPALGAGVLEEVRVQRDKGFGFVGYNTHEEAARATQMANGRPVCGKTMKCSWGSKPTPPGTASNPLPPPVAQPYQILPTAEMTVSAVLKQKSSSIEGIENWPYEASACQIKIKKDHL
ncbi:oligouridylate-binding protein 1-like [Lathyrus oleraceus]|uniref:oligouridylate-binding protein 1-like n=1 Tax=Pisum sativum TaxID=3888 RepID=UPI0021CEF329|nr:oligouridylate-binding protein 1-like [Pisum sativum]